MKWIDEAHLHYVCRVPEVTTWQGCNFAYILSTGIMSNGMDLSHYKTLNLGVRYTGKSQYVRVSIRSFDPRFSKLDDGNSTKLSLNDTGDLIAVGSGESVEAPIPRHAFIYRKVGDAWKLVRDIQAMPGTEYCDVGALSADGSTLVQACREVTESDTGSGILRNYVRTHSGANWTIREEMALELDNNGTDEGVYSYGLAVDRTGSTIAAQILVDAHSGEGPSEVHVFHRDGGAYSRVARLAPGAWRTNLGPSLGYSVAISDDGSTLAVGDFWDDGYGTGPRAAPLNPGTNLTGAVYVYRLKTTWRLANMVKPNYLVGHSTEFGRPVALNGNGQTLIVGHNYEASPAQGIGGNWASTDAPYSGAVWMY